MSRMENEFKIDDGILTQISKIDDQQIRIICLLLLQGMEKISQKIDNLVHDEVALRKAVLNGIAHKHEADHDWIDDHKVQTAQNKQILTRAEPIIVWAEAKIKAEKEAEKNKKTLVMRALEAIVTQAGTILATATAVYLGIKVF